MILDQLSTNPAERIRELRVLITHHNEQYHSLDAPEIPDADYDLLATELRRLEAAHPELAGSALVGQAVGAAPSALRTPPERAGPEPPADPLPAAVELARTADNVLALRREAQGLEHKLTRRPKNPHCEICARTRSRQVYQKRGHSTANCPRGGISSLLTTSTANAPR